MWCGRVCVSISFFVCQFVETEVWCCKRLPRISLFGIMYRRTLATSLVASIFF